MIEAWRVAATKPARGVGSVAALLTLALGCVVGSPAWSACPPGQSNCQSSEPPREAPPQPRPQQFEAPRPQPMQPQFQTQPQVQQRPLQFEQPRQQQVQQPQQFQQPRQAVPSQAYRPNPTTGGPPASCGRRGPAGPVLCGLGAGWRGAASGYARRVLRLSWPQLCAIPRRSVSMAGRHALSALRGWRLSAAGIHPQRLCHCRLDGLRTGAAAAGL